MYKSIIAVINPLKIDYLCSEFHLNLIPFNRTMLENLRTVRRFNSLIITFIVITLTLVIHLGFFIDIPYIPTMLCFKLPALFIITFAYYLSMLTLNSIKVRGQIRNNKQCKYNWTFFINYIQYTYWSICIQNLASDS